MELTQAIKTRRSIRNYLDKKVDINQIISLVEYAMYAPSAHNEQPWQFIVIDDKNILKEISWIHQWIKMAKDASVGVLICWDLNKDIANWFWVQDCSAATQNFLLAINDSGLWAVWTWIYPQEDLIIKFSKLFELPSNIIPFAFVPIWYPVDAGKAWNRFKKEKIHINKR